MSYGHALKTAGRHDRQHRRLSPRHRAAPALGEAYWSLANLKTFRFRTPTIGSDARAARRATTSSDEDRLHLDFALGKALEDAGDYDGSFEHYAEGNALRRQLHPYDADENTRFVACAAMALFTPEFFAARAGPGVRQPDPIFIVGLPRSGSTLIEQILASHSGRRHHGAARHRRNRTRARRARAGRGDEPAYPEALADLAPETLRRARRAVSSSAHARSSARPAGRSSSTRCRTTSLHVGLIHLILPNAKIIDARRHPLGCCFSAFKQHFARGQSFSYDLERPRPLLPRLRRADGALRRGPARAASTG